MFAPEPLQQQQHSSGTSLVFRNEHTKMNTISRFKFSFSHFSSAWCYRTDKKKKSRGEELKSTYQLILLAHKVLLSSGA